MSKSNFIIAEKSYIVRAGLVGIINGLRGSEVVREVMDLEQLVKILNKINPEFAIINIKLLADENCNIKSLFSKKIQTKFIAFVETADCKKQFPSFDEIICIDDDKPEISQKILKLLSANKKTVSETFEGPTEREKEIIRQIALGKTNKEIAEELFISTHTVMTHRKNITAKLAIKTVSGLTVYAILNHLITMEEAAG